MGRIKPQTLLLQSKKKKGPTRISLSTIVTCNLVVVLIVLSLVATYRHWYSRSSDRATDGLQNPEDIESFGEVKKFDLPSYAILNTSKGSISVELYKDGSPEIVDKFLDLWFMWRVILVKGILQRYALSSCNKTLRNSRRGYTKAWSCRRLDSEGISLNQLATSPKHEAFMLGTSKARQGSKDFELFITTAPIPDLSDKIVVFGRVVKGEDVVQEIEEVDTDEHYRPKSPIGIINVTLKRQL